MSGANDIQLRELKDTILQLNKTISTQNTLILSLQKSIDESNARVSEKDQVIANLQAQLEYLKTKLFGSTSEVRKNVFPGQLSIFDTEDDSEKDAVPVEPEFIEVKSHNRSRKPKATYDEIFENIKTTQVMVDELPEDERICPECGSLMEPVGKKTIRTEIVYHKASLERIEYVANSYRCPNAYKEAETPFLHDQCKPALIEGSYVSSGLAAHVMYYKYVLACPLYRQEQDFLHLGARISRSTMAKWIITSSQKYLVHMYEFLHRKLCERQFLMADETPIQVLKEPERRPQSKSYVWVFRTGEDQGIPIVLFHYTPTRKGANAAEFLSNATEGYFLMTDGYKGYNKVPDANRCACWAHIRRDWLKAIPKGHEQDHTHPAVQGLLYCDKLFRYERQYKEKGLSVKQIYKRRLKDQEPVIDAFLSWVDGLTNGRRNNQSNQLHQRMSPIPEKLS